jgi:hypothetical protein
VIEKHKNHNRGDDQSTIFLNNNDQTM